MSMLVTPLGKWHQQNHGRMVEFAGWEMPVQYTSIVEEHLAVRAAAGLFDISHMGRLRLAGPFATEFLNRVVTIDVSRMRAGQVRYTLVCNHEGGILDDILVYRLDAHWELVVNASNRLKLLEWFEHTAGYAAVQLTDVTTQTAMLAIQGPHAARILQAFGLPSASALKYYTCAAFRGPSSDECLMSRTGYTGEDGFELTIPAQDAETVWQRLLDVGRDFNINPAGLGCRDTLRLEAAMPLYGHELSEQIDPLSVGLGFAVHFDKQDFCGKAALEQIRRDEPKLRRVGLILEGRRIARENSAVLSGDHTIGTVTSGTFSPTLQQVIAMALIPAELQEPGLNVEVDIRGSRVPARTTTLPFYRRAG